MPFRVKDILIDVLQPQPCAQHTTILCHFYCTFPVSVCHIGCTFVTCNFHHSVIPCTVYCTHIQSLCGPSVICPGGSIVCPGGSACPGGSVFDPGLADPTVIRQRLQQQLAAAQAAEEVAADAMQPQTLEQVDLLEGKLKAALEDLGRRRQELSQKK